MEKSLNKIDFNKEQIDLIKTQIAPGTTDDQLKLFLYQCKRTGLDPLTRQIYCVLRNSKNRDTGQWEKRMTIQTAIDGFRVIAERSGDYGGQGEPIFNEVDGKLISVKVTVYRFRGDIRYEAAVGVAHWNEYVPDGGQDKMWLKMPHAMLSKVAEALALRKAFPQDLSGLYITEEMHQADRQEQPPSEGTKTEAAQDSKQKPPITEKQFTKACERVQKGETEVYGQVLDAFSLSDEQKTKFIKVYGEAIKTANKAEYEEAQIV